MTPSDSSLLLPTKSLPPISANILKAFFIADLYSVALLEGIPFLKPSFKASNVLASFAPVRAFILSHSISLDLNISRAS